MKKSDGKLLPVRLYHRIPVSTDGAPGATRTLVINRAAASGDSDALRDAEIRFTRFFNSTPVAIFAEALSGNSDINPIDLSINGDEDRHVRFYVSHVAQVDDRDKADKHDDERVIV